MPKKVLFMSVSGDALPVAHRVKREKQVDVAVYLHNPRYQHCYDGLLEKVTLPNLRRTLKSCDLVFFDITRTNERFRSEPETEMVHRDAQLLMQFGLKSTEKSVYGPVADVMRQDIEVIGCSALAEEAEMDRMLGFEIAKEIGLKVPESHEFKNFDDGVKFLEAHQDSLWIQKPQGNDGFTYLETWEGELATMMQAEWKEKYKKPYPFVLQKVLPKGSVEIDCEGWFDGRDLQAVNFTMEDKQFLTGEWGQQIGCQNTVVWIKQQEGFLTKELNNLKPFLLDAGHIGPVNITVMVNRVDHSVNWLEATFRPGYDALPVFLSLLETPITHFLYSRFHGTFKKGYAAGERITIPPFPICNKEELEKKARGVSVKNHSSTPWFWLEDVRLGDRKWLECAGADGIIGVVTATGNTVEAASHEVYGRVKRVKVCGKLQLRTDLGRRAQRHIPRLTEWGFNVR